MLCFDPPLSFDKKVTIKFHQIGIRSTISDIMELETMKSLHKEYDWVGKAWRLVYQDDRPWYRMVQLWEDDEFVDTVTFDTEKEYKRWATVQRADDFHSFPPLDERTDTAKRDAEVGKKLARDLAHAERELGRAAYKMFLLIKESE